MKHKEVAVKDRQLLKIVLKEESTALNEVVVVGYGTMKRKEMTSAISHVGAKDLNQISSLDASMLLQGKYPVCLFPIRLWPIRTVREVSRFVAYLRVMPGWVR